LKLNPGKCCFAARSITFLGHVVSHEGTRPDPSKITVVVHFPVPKTVMNVKSFLGLTGYYQNYVRGYSRLAVPMFELTRKDVAFVWDLGCQSAFEALKGALVAAPMLTQPDFKKPFALMWIGHRRVSVPFYLRRKAGWKELLHMLAKV